MSESPPNISTNGKEVSFSLPDSNNEVSNFIYLYYLFPNCIFAFMLISRKLLPQKCLIKVTDRGLCQRAQQIHVVLVSLLYLRVYNLSIGELYLKLYLILN